MVSVYRELGVRTVINATGTLTRVGGTLMPPEVVAAMAEAAQAFVRIEDLQEAAGRVIAEITGAEAGYVTSGAAAGLTLATAACAAGLDPDKMDRLPDTTGMKNEVIIQRAHRNSYDHAIRAAGVKLVEVGYLGFPGAGGTHPWQIEAAINDTTAAIAYPIIEAQGTVPLPEVVKLAHRHGIPVIVDAAAALPPPQNLRRFIAEGADLVVFSGGKAVRGPQASGILCGRRDLIESVALQHQDMDVHPQTWTYRQRYLDTGLLPGPPHHGLGRAMKVGKEEIVGLITALKLYVQRDHQADQENWRCTVGRIISGLEGLPHVQVMEVVPPQRPVPQAHVLLDEKGLGLTAYEVINRLLEGDPIVCVGEGYAREGKLVINPLSLQDGDEQVIVARLRALLAPG